MLAFPDKPALLTEVARVLEPGGRFAFTVEAGEPLTAAEQTRMPDADTVWLIDMAEMTALLGERGLTVTWQDECSAAHCAMATALLQSFREDSARIAGQIGARALNELITAHELWWNWLGRGRVRKFAVVAEKR
jgi:hypothetical protein